MAAARFSPGWPSLRVTTLGAVTIVAYGVAYYAYGALIDPIRATTHWPLGALGTVFSGGLVIGGVGGLAGGRIADRFGTRPGLLIGGLLGAAAILTASFAHSLLGFGASYAVGCGAIGATAFYQATQPAAIRSAPGAPAAAVVWLTLFGALASPIFLPLTGALVNALGWRGALRVQAALVALVLVAAAMSAGGAPRVRRAAPSHDVVGGLLRAWRTPGFRSWIAGSVLAGAAIDVVLVYQVPAMHAAGLPLATAVTLAGARGIAQLAGRLPITPVLRLIGTRLAIVGTLLIGVASALLLAVSGELVGAIAFVITGGISIGAIYTLQGIFTSELVNGADLGLVMGAQQAVFAAGGAAGPALAGIAIGLTHSYTPTLVATAACFATAAIAIVTGRAPLAQIVTASERPSTESS